LDAFRAALLPNFMATLLQGKFLLIDMSPTGAGQWRQWKHIWGDTPYIWTTTNNFGTSIADPHFNAQMRSMVPLNKRFSGHW
jgi:hypothetical protein